MTTPVFRLGVPTVGVLTTGTSLQSSPVASTDSVLLPVLVAPDALGPDGFATAGRVAPSVLKRPSTPPTLALASLSVAGLADDGNARDHPGPSLHYAYVLVLVLTRDLNGGTSCGSDKIVQRSLPIPCSPVTCGSHATAFHREITDTVSSLESVT